MMKLEKGKFSQRNFSPPVAVNIPLGQGSRLPELC